MAVHDIILAAANASAGGGGGGANPNAGDFYNYATASDRGDYAVAFNPRSLTNSANYATSIRNDIYSAFSAYPSAQSMYGASQWAFKSDGTKFFWSDGDQRYFYGGTMSTAWDLSTITWTDKVAYGTGTTTDYFGFWCHDGTNLYVNNNDNFIHFTLDTAWDLSSTLTHVVTKSPSTFAAQNSGTSTNAPTTWASGNLTFANNGQYIYFATGSGNNYLYVYRLISGGTAYDLDDYQYDGSSTARVTWYSTAVGTGMTTIANSTGTELLLHSTTQNTSGSAFKVTVSNPDDLSSGVTMTEATSYNIFAIGTTATTYPWAISPFRTTCDNANGKNFVGTIYDTSMDGLNVPAIEMVHRSWGPIRPGVGGLSTAEQTVTSFGASFVGDSGTKLYLTTNYDWVMQFTLDEPYEIVSGSTGANWVGNGNASAQEGTPTSLFFKDDGTKMYLIGHTNKTVYQYSLSTAWDITTLSYDSVSYTPTGISSFPHIFFGDSGTKLYYTTYATRKLYRADLSTAWDLSTASYNGSQTLTMNTATNYLVGSLFNPDGTKVWLFKRTVPEVEQFTLSTAWDLTSASYDGSFNMNFSGGLPLPSVESPIHIGFSIDDTAERFYVRDYRSGRLTQFTVSGT